MFVEEKALAEPQVEQKIQPSLAGFISWLETKNPDETYPYTNSCDCACAQYLKAINQFHPWWLSDPEHNFQGLMTDLNHLAAGKSNSEGAFNTGAWTFGLLLDRAKAAA